MLVENVFSYQESLGLLKSIIMDDVKSKKALKMSVI